MSDEKQARIEAKAALRTLKRDAPLGAALLSASLAEFLEAKNPDAKALGRLGGKVKSEAKAAASRKNGKLGGRPKKPAK